MNRYSDAANDLKTANLLHPNDKEIQFMIGSLEIRFNNLEEGEKHIDSALEFDDSYVDALEAKAFSEIKKGNYVEAKNICKRMINIEPTFALSYSNLGYIEAISGDTLTGIKNVRKAIEMSPKDPYMHKWLGEI